MKKLANEYLITFQDGSTAHAVTISALEAVKAYETAERAVVQITRQRSALEVSFPDVPVPAPFITVVEPQAARDAGCLAAPSAFTVDGEDRVVFQALPAAGYAFVGWYHGATELSTDAIARLAVTAPPVGEGVTEYEARFEAI
jgi:hypothetical protein